MTRAAVQAAKVITPACVLSRHRPVGPGGCRKVVEPSGVEAQDLALGRLRQLRIVVLVADLFGNLEAPERLDLPLRRAVVDAVRAEADLVLAEILEELAHDVRAHRREGDDASGEGRA